MQDREAVLNLAKAASAPQHDPHNAKMILMTKEEVALWTSVDVPSLLVELLDETKPKSKPVKK